MDDLDFEMMLKDLAGVKAKITKVESVIREFMVEDRRTTKNSLDYAEMIHNSVCKFLHPFFRYMDLMFTSDILMVMRDLYPDECYFQSTDRSANIKIGVILGKMKYWPSLTASYTIPGDSSLGIRSSTRNVKIWVFRNYDKYKKMEKSELYQIHKLQWLNATRKVESFNNMSFL